MNLLTEVDQPGSAIDQYVERLDKILKQKLEGVAMLQVGEGVERRKRIPGQELEACADVGTVVTSHLVSL